MHKKSEPTLKNSPRISATELQSQLKVALLSLEHDLKKSLGPHTIQQIMQSGLDLPSTCKKTATHLVEEINREFSLYQESSELDFSYKQKSYKNPDKPQYLEDGYIEMHLSEKQVLRYFLRQKQIYKTVLEEIINYIILYVEKSYYRIEEYWQDFQNHYIHPSSDISLKEPDTLSSTSRKITEKHQKIQQLQTISQSFWKENFTRALQQLHIRLGQSFYLSATDQENLSNTPREDLELPQIPFVPANINIAILQKLPHRELLEDLRLKLEYTLERQDCPLILQTPSKTLPKTAHNKYDKYDTYAFHYAEYPQTNNSVLAAEVPDEQISISLFYTDVQKQSEGTLETLEDSEALAQVSDKIRNLFIEIEKSTRFNRSYALLHSLYQKIFSRQKQNSANSFQAEQFQAEQSQAEEEQMPSPTELLSQEKMQNKETQNKDSTNKSQQRTQNQHPHQAESSAEDLQPHSPLYREAEILLEILRQSEITLQYQLQYNSQAQHYRMHSQLKTLRRELLLLCRQPQPEKPGLYLTTQYCTARFRRETYWHLKRVLEDFKKICLYGWI